MPITDYVKTMRPLNCLMAAVACFVGYAVASSKILFSSNILVGMAVVFLVCGAGQAINDYFDRRIDAKLHPGKPIPSGRIKPKDALFFSLALFVLAIIISLPLPLQSTLIAIVFSLLLIFYSSLLRRLKFIGNYVVALGTGFAIIFGASISGSMLVPSLLAASAFFSNAAREIIKDFEDLQGDRGTKLTLPMILPKKTVLAIIFLFYIIGMFFVYTPYFSSMFGNTFFLLIVSFANLVFFYSFKLVTESKYKKAQFASKAAMAIALLSFIAGVAL